MIYDERNNERVVKMKWMIDFYCKDVVCKGTKEPVLFHSEELAQKGKTFKDIKNFCDSLYLKVRFRRLQQ